MRLYPATALGAVILAGGKTVVDDNSVVPTASLDFGGKSLGQLVTEAVAQVVPRTVFVGPSPSWEIGSSVKVVEPGLRLPDNLELGLKAFREFFGGSSAQPASLLVVPVDQPFLTSSGLANFTQRAIATRADFAYAICDYRECLDAYPGMKRTGWPWITGKKTGGNVMLANTAKAELLLDFAKRIYPIRKKPLRVARVGIDFLFRHRLTIRFVEAAPAIGADVDSLEQYRQACRLMGYTPTV